MARAAKKTGGDINPEHDALPESRALHEAHDKRMLDRMLFFTDAVFAIVMTLLVLELRPPELEQAGIWAALAGLTPKFIAFGMSFALAAIFWVAHLSTTRRLIHFDWPTAWANLAFLLPVTLMPFASALLGERFGGEAHWQVYCVLLIAASALMTAFLLVASRDGGRLMGGLTGRERGFRALRALAPGISFAIGLALEAAGRNGLSHFCWLLIAVVMLIARATLGPKAA
jgi:uncharacterized membrane protein